MTVTRQTLTDFLSQTLNSHAYQDYGPNGLQIEGANNIKKVAFAVSATKDSIEECVASGADTFIVHHGLFWKFHGVRPLTGTFAKRVLPLTRHQINLIAYHLPLDAHLEYGNAAMLAKKLELINLKPFGDYKGMPTGVHGTFHQPIASSQLCSKLEQVLSHPVLHSCPNDGVVSSMGIITGGANGDWIHAQNLKLDAYLTGEMSEHDWHEAKEGGVHMYAGGHHATERYGVQALQKLVEKEFGVETLFIDSDNPA